MLTKDLPTPAHKDHTISLDPGDSPDRQPINYTKVKISDIQFNENTFQDHDNTTIQLMTQFTKPARFSYCFTLSRDLRSHIVIVSQ